MSARGRGQGGALGPGRAREHDQAGADVLVHRLAHDLVLPLEVVHAVLLVRELAAALGAHEGVLLPALVLQMSVEIVVPVVGSLQHDTGLKLNLLLAHIKSKLAG